VRARRKDKNKKEIKSIQHDDALKTQIDGSSVSERERQREHPAMGMRHTRT
jgi:hypothetical protein